MIKAAVHVLSPQGVGEKIGYITFSDTDEGLLIKPDLQGLPSGYRGFHIHEFGDLRPKDGKAAGMAGQHYDPLKTGKHLGPYKNGHLGDLPRLFVRKDGSASTAVVAPRLLLEDVVGRAVIIHKGGDNYSDTPLPNGGGVSRIAGGVITNKCPYCKSNATRNLALLALAGYSIFQWKKR